MPGGLYALVAYGAQDIRLTGNPDINYFSNVYHTHVHLAKEPIMIMPENRYDSLDRTRVTEMRFTVKRWADFLHGLNLIVQLPELRVTEDDTYHLRWSPYPGLAMIEEIRITIGGAEIQTLDRDRIFALYNLDMPEEKQILFEEMVGHVNELVNPQEGIYKTVSDYTYPFATPGDTFSIPTREICVPLPFWFTQEVSSSLPIGFMTQNEVNVTVRLAPYEQLIQVRDTSNGTWTRPSSTFDITGYFTHTGRSWNLNPRIEGEFYYIDANVREHMMEQEMIYPVFRSRDYTVISEQTTVQGSTRIFDLINTSISNSLLSPSLQDLRTNHTLTSAIDNISFRIRQESNPIRRLILLPRRQDFLDNNQWDRLGNFEDPTNGRDASGYVRVYNDEIVQDFSIILNGNPLVEGLRPSYLSHYDAYKFHTGNNKRGVLCYSFGVFNERAQTKGTLNASRIREPVINIRTTPTTISPSVYSVKLLVESINWFKFNNGFGGLAYAV